MLLLHQSATTYSGGSPALVRSEIWRILGSVIETMRSSPLRGESTHLSVISSRDRCWQWAHKQDAGLDGSIRRTDTQFSGFRCG
jgi:hypothetical protein